MPVQLPVRNREPETSQASAESNGVPNPSLVDTLPLPLVLWLAKPYLAGKTLDDAVRKAQELWKQSRFTSTIDILGEDCTNERDCDNFVEAYRKAIDAVAANQLPGASDVQRATISFKPSMFSTVVPTATTANRDEQLADAYYRIKTVVDYGRQRGVRMTIEAEDHNWTDFQLNTYFSLLNEGYDNLGTVLQSRLFRTRDDIKRFDERGRVRLVIGIYNEPAEIALTDKAVMKERLVDYADELARRGVYLEIASHDAACQEKFIQRVAVAQRLPANRFETQWLLGVPRKDVQEALVSGKYFAQLAENAHSSSLEYLSDLARAGTTVRMYLPYGKDAVAGPYCKRRLRANPHMISYGIKNFFNLR
jgi:proline dehydrogenase